MPEIRKSQKVTQRLTVCLVLLLCCLFACAAAKQINPLHETINIIFLLQLALPRAFNELKYALTGLLGLLQPST